MREFGYNSHVRFYKSRESRVVLEVMEDCSRYLNYLVRCKIYDLFGYESYMGVFLKHCNTYNCRYILFRTGFTLIG